MLRSFGYATASAGIPKDARAQAERAAREAFLGGYLPKMAGSRILPDDDKLPTVLDALELEKALYEVRYELQMRPDWAHIPVESLLRLEVKP